MKKQQAGFTLIELVVVIVLLGILGAAATARFQDLSTQAKISAASGIAGEISSGSAINFASRSLDATAGVAITGCADFAGLLQQGAPADYTVTETTACGGAAGTTAVCNVADDTLAAANADFTVICIP
jgi:MSHA pilin protein MshA